VPPGFTIGAHLREGDWVREFRLACAIVAAWTAGPNGLAGQSVRITGVTHAQYVDLQPLRVDSIPASETFGSGILRRAPNGAVVRCLTGEDYCLLSGAGESVYALPLLQDVSVSAWGLGRGVRFFARLRGRASASQETGLWPKGNDAFDALVAYLELDRGDYRVRGGRQWMVSGLGFYNFDGASVLYRPVDGLAVEGYGGWSLARGLDEPRTSASLSAIEPFAPDDRGMILGISGTYRPSLATSVSALYQREIRTDRRDLYTDRVAMDGVIRRWGMSLTGSLEADLAGRQVNEAKLTGRFVGPGRLDTQLFARRYRPFFELWTIWGAFSPVGFTEGGLETRWRSERGSIVAGADLSRRSYDETSLSSTFGPIRSDGWRAGLSLSGLLSDIWKADGRYDLDVGFGAAKSAASVRVHRTLPENGRLGFSLQAFQRIFEFRVDEGTVFGLGVDGGMKAGSRGYLSGTFAAYRHAVGRDSPGVDWSQLRASLRWEWTLGPEPGMEGRQ